MHEDKASPLMKAEVDEEGEDEMDDEQEDEQEGEAAVKLSVDSGSIFRQG